MEPWVIAMMCATVLIGMGTCGACCHKKGKSYVREKEAKLRDRALSRAKELVHMKAHGAEELLQDVQTYHDMHHRSWYRRCTRSRRRAPEEHSLTSLVATLSAEKVIVASQGTITWDSAAPHNQ
jgi:hypothetical protein